MKNNFQLSIEKGRTNNTENQRIVQPFVYLNELIPRANKSETAKQGLSRLLRLSIFMQ
jgi:hypothetical protein